MPGAPAVTRSAALFERAGRVIPGGVNSPVRAFRAVGGQPRFIASGRGAWLTDVDGNRLVDLVSSWGAVLLGHAHPAVADAVARAARAGSGFGTPTEGEVLLAEELAVRMPWLEQLRLVSSGTEATMSAIRLARAATGRAKVVKFAGCYHGHSDALLADAGSGVATLGIPGTPGVTPGTAADTLVISYNDVAALESAFAQWGGEIACVITEAVPANMGVVPPAAGYNSFLRGITRRFGALLVVDEVVTGLRTGPAGWCGVEGIEPDLATYGKALGGGLPLALFGGRHELMSLLAPEGPVYQAGTLSGNPIAVAAALAVLRHCTAETHQRLARAADGICSAVGAALSARGVPHQLNRAGTLFSVFFTDRTVTDYATAAAQSVDRYATFFRAMLGAGVLLPPSGFEGWFVTAAHDEEAIGRVGEAAEAAAEAVAG